MGRLIYSAIASLDGYVVDADGSFDWAAPDEEVHAFVNDQERQIGTYLYGRRMYEAMLAWETMDDEAPVMRDYTQVWQSADKVVYSSTLTGVRSKRTRLERGFEPGGRPPARRRGGHRREHRWRDPRGQCPPGRAGRRAPTSTSTPWWSAAGRAGCLTTYASILPSSTSTASPAGSSTSATPTAGRRDSARSSRQRSRHDRWLGDSPVRPARASWPGDLERPGHGTHQATDAG